MHVFTMIFIFAIAALGLRVLMTTGLVSFAHSAFMAIGGYASALLATRLGISFWLALPIAALTAGIIGFLLGQPILRLKGHYFFIVTFAFYQIANLTFTRWTNLFGGFSGIAGIPGAEPITIPAVLTIRFESLTANYYLMLFFITVITLILWIVNRSRFGLICRGIATSEPLIQALGINIGKYRTAAFVISCICAGIAGSLYAHYIRFINPTSYDLWITLYILMYVLVGGVDSIVGPLVGTSVLMLMRTAIAPIAMYERILFSVILIATVLFMPKGIISIFRLMLERVKGVVERQESLSRFIRLKRGK